MVLPSGLRWERVGGGTAWRIDLGVSSCLSTIVRATTSDGGAFVFQNATPFNVTAQLFDGGLPFDGGMPEGEWSTLRGTASCSSTASPSFAAGTSSATVGLRATRIGLYQVAANVPGAQVISPLTVAPGGYRIYPVDGGVWQTGPNNTACVEIEVRVLPFGLLGALDRRTFVETGMDLVFTAMPAPPPQWHLATSCTSNTVLAIRLPAGRDRVRAALQVTDAGFAEDPFFAVMLAPEIQGLSGGAAGSLQGQSSPPRICIPTGTSPASECADTSECCNGTAECAVVAGAPVCRP